MLMKSNRVIHVLKHYKISKNELYNFLRFNNINTANIAVSTMLSDDICQLIDAHFGRDNKTNTNIGLIDGQKSNNGIENKTDDEMVSGVAENSVQLMLEWENVRFEDEKIILIYNGFEYPISYSHSKTIYNTIIKTFSQRLSPLCVEIYNATARLVDPIVINNVVKILQFQENIFHIFKNPKERGRIDIRHIGNMTKHFASILCDLNKTEYLEFLQDIQDSEKAIIPLYENRTITPNGFIFTIKYHEQYFLMWENVEKLSHRASYVFHTPHDKLSLLQQLIFDYTFSNIACKRENLRNKRVKEFLGFDYFYVDHDNFQSWKNLLLKHIDKAYKSGIIKKNEQQVSYKVNQERTYIPKHNIIQNKLKQNLTNSGLYIDVQLESDHVDIKAVTKFGEWHFYEIKTSLPKQCIREALGQILEYAHFPFDYRAKKLYIIGCYALSDNEIKYMQLLRNIYNLPIWYRWFNEQTNILSDEY